MRKIAPEDTSELEAVEQREWRESLDYVIQQGDRGRVQRLLTTLRHHARMAGRQPAVHGRHPLRQHDSSRRADPAPRQPGNRAPDQEPRPLERHGDGRPRQPDLGRDRRPHLDLCVRRDAVRSRLQSFLPRQGEGRRRRHHLFPGARVARDLRPRVPRGTAVGGEAAELPPRARARRRSLLVSPPVADARVLGIPDRLDGPRADHVDLPGAVQPLPRGSRSEEAVHVEGLDVCRRRRNRRAGVARRHQPGGAREARQPHLRHQLQPAASRRPGARQRPDHPGARGHLPRRRLERHQGHLGQRLGSAPGRRHGRPARQPDGGDRRRSVPEVRGRRRRVHARAFLRRRSAPARHGQAPVGRPAEAAAARRPRSREGLQRLQGGDRHQGAADGRPRAHDQGVRARRGG